jgi:hypothetical protein
MATQVNTPFSSNSGPPGGTPPPSGSPQRLALDNLIRRELRVADPNDPLQVAQALLSRYKGDPRAVAIAQEARGLPFLQTVSTETRMVQAPTSSDAELQQAMDDVERDLRELTTNNLLKDVTPELEGWAAAVRSAISEGATAARFALDPRQRDKSFAIRRQLGDYARVARLVGALTPAVNMEYRSFAQSLDEVGAVLLVLMGEALANVGFAGGRFLLQAPYTELQVRRDAAIYALRNLVGATQEAYGPNDWPRGLDAYRRLFDVLEAQGQGDLRALLVETELVRTMDTLIQRSAHGTAQGLRALGSTAQIDLQRFYRLVSVGRRTINPESPPLTAFFETLRLFADAFNSDGGFRLLHIARPSILFYGLYGSQETEHADRRLTELITRRGILAGQLDCLMRCDCDEDTVICQIVLDKILYDVDRAIDLYAVGEEELGAPEIRAAAYSYVIETAQDPMSPPLPNPPLHRCGTAMPISGTLRIIRDLLRPFPRSNQLVDWETTPEDFDARRQQNSTVGDQRFCDLLTQELCMQREMEQSWENVVRGMAPNCISASHVFGPNAILPQIIHQAINRVLNRRFDAPVDCGRVDPDIPAHFESSLHSLIFNSGPTGDGRRL